jgi:hypothetical protein
MHYEFRNHHSEFIIALRRRSTLTFDGFHSSEENMAIESSSRIVSTTVLGLR